MKQVGNSSTICRRYFQEEELKYGQGEVLGAFFSLSPIFSNKCQERMNEEFTLKEGGSSSIRYGW